MATAPSLFGATPESIQQARDEALNQQANAYAQQDPFQRASAGLYRSGNQLGGAIGRMLGGQDPEMEKASLIRQLASQADTSTPEGMLSYARSLQTNGFTAEAFAVSQQAQKMRSDGLSLTAKQQGVDATVASQTQQAAFRQAVADLGPNPTQAQLLATASKFGDPTTLVRSLGISADKEDARIQRENEFKSTQEERARIERERREERARLQTERLDASAADSREASADRRNNLNIALAAKGERTLSARLQGDEGKDLETIDAGTAQLSYLAPAIASLTPNKQGVRQLELGPLKNARYVAQNATGRSTPESRSYEALKSAVATAVNLQVSAEKGVQTDKDVLRFANALVAAYGNNDSEATLNALSRYRDAISKATERTKVRLESRRKSQNVEPYGFTTAPPRITVFASEAEATAANLPVDTEIIINGRRAKVR